MARRCLRGQNDAQKGGQSGDGRLREAPQQQAEPGDEGEGRQKAGHLQEEKEGQRDRHDHCVRQPARAAPLQPGTAQQHQHGKRRPAPAVVKPDMGDHASAVAWIPRHAGQPEDGNEKQRGNGRGRPPAQGDAGQREQHRRDQDARRLHRAGELPGNLAAQPRQDVRQGSHRGWKIDAGHPVLVQAVDPAEERHEVVQGVSLDGRAMRGEQGEAQRDQSERQCGVLPRPGARQGGRGERDAGCQEGMSLKVCRWVGYCPVRWKSSGIYRWVSIGFDGGALAVC